MPTSPTRAPAKLYTLLAWAVVVLVVDQWTKTWVVANVPFRGEHVVISGLLSIGHHLNRGILLGMLWGSSLSMFVALSLGALALIVSFYRMLAMEDRWFASALGLLLGGALGNLVDRLVHGGVVDFVHVQLGAYAYPDFNVADAAIVAAIGVLLIYRRPEPDLHAEGSGSVLE